MVRIQILDLSPHSGLRSVSHMEIVQKRMDVLLPMHIWYLILASSEHWFGIYLFSHAVLGRELICCACYDKI